MSPGQGGPPGAPTNLAAAPDGSSAVTLSWDPPASDGGAGIIYYDVLEGTSLLPDVPASDTSDTVAVASGTVYTFQVSATNDYEQQGPAATVTYPASQTITFGPLASQPVNARFTVSATATSGLAVMFSSGTPAVCAVSGRDRHDGDGRHLHDRRRAGRERRLGGGREHPAVLPGRLVTPAGRLPLLIGVAAAVIVAAAAAGLAVRRRRLRSRPSLAADLGVRAVPHAGPPATVRLQATGTGATHTVRIEPHPGASVTTIEESQP